MNARRAERPIKLYIFDADGTLRRSTVPGQPCPNGPGQWELIPGVRERLARIEWGDGRARFGVATNQGGIGLGYLTIETARAMLVEMVEQAFGVAPPVGSIEICPHAPHLGCACRKPRPGMLRSLMHRFKATRAETLFVGDMDRDREAARRAGVRFSWAYEFFGRPGPAH
ncbi:MAG TPA: HAD-IIIA family hydrolase [Pyrinomonadaceae bacterium]|nr:HAD-IIIA family hydrolase [Pyrinomonadaceae bacterium]